MTPEGRVKAKVKDIIKAYKPAVYSHWPVLNGMGEPTLDCIGCVNGQFFAVETKAEGKKLTPRQELTRTQMWKAGGVVFEIVGCDSPALKVLDEWLQQQVLLSQGG